MRIAVSILLVLFSAASCFAQEPNSSRDNASPARGSASESTVSRPKIGVALEGGGALGEAHVGVLKWFEDHHIPIDYLAGTSMGGLVGGMYATGKSADDIRDILQSADWPLLLGGGTPYESLAFRRKEDARDIPNAIQIGLKNGPTLPAGLNSGQQINLLIDREVFPYSNINSFNDLPIPFRCVSTELVSGEPYIFHDGSLSDAMRATISIPGVFAPLRDKDKIFVDGGLVDNLPTDVVRKMGADVVIAVHLQISKTSAKEIQSAFGVLGRSVELVIAETEIRGMAGADLIVTADVEKYSTSDYDKTNDLIATGYAAAEEKAPILKTYALDDAAWAAYLSQKQARRRTAKGIPEFVRVEGVTKEGQINIERYMTKFLGKRLDDRALDEVLTRLAGIGRYDSITYSMIHEGGRDGLLVRVYEKSYAPPLLQPSVVVDGSEPQDVNFTLGARVTAMDVWGYGSEWRTDFQFGGTYGISTELFRPFRPLSKFFFAPFVDASQTTFKIYTRSDPRAEYRLNNVLGGIDLGISINRFSEIRMGYGIGYTDYKLRLGAPDFNSAGGRVGAFHLRYVLDHTNEAVIPTKGIFLRSQFDFYDTNPLTNEAFPSFQTVAQGFQPIGDFGSVYLTAEGASTFGRTQLGSPIYFLGGVGRLSAYGLNELIGNQYFLARTGYLHKIFTLPPFVGKQVYLTGFGELGKMYGDPFRVPKLSADVGGGLLAETSFGPVLIGGSLGDTGHRKWFFQLGRVF